MRQEGDARVLLYAMEIGSSGFLGGSVELRDRAVSDSQQADSEVESGFSPTDAT